ncbi:trichohyalin-like [Engraulis encrasicolus]|uniref:trichohyalin-like n=1 Tax=Engraulis encrasicolus TaxID=184585 RepID=UPI002FD1846C
MERRERERMTERLWTAEKIEDEKKWLEEIMRSEKEKEERRRAEEEPDWLRELLSAKRVEEQRPRRAGEEERQREAERYQHHLMSLEHEAAMEREVAKKKHDARIKELTIEVEANYQAAVRKLEEERALSQRREAELRKLLELEQQGFQGVQGVLRHADGPPTWTWDQRWRKLKRQLREMEQRVDMAHETEMALQRENEERAEMALEREMALRRENEERAERERVLERKLEAAHQRELELMKKMSTMEKDIKKLREKLVEDKTQEEELTDSSLNAVLKQKESPRGERNGLFSRLTRTGSKFMKQKKQKVAKMEKEADCDADGNEIQDPVVRRKGPKKKDQTAKRSGNEVGRGDSTRHEQSR